MPIDLQQARRDTPGTEQVLHFNNAGSSLTTQPVLDAVIKHLHLEAQIGGYEAADRMQTAIEHVYDASASLLHCSRDEIAIVDSATTAWDRVFYAIPFQAGDRILTCMTEYASNYIAYLQVARRTGAIVEAVPNDEYGQMSLEALNTMIDERVKLIAVTHVPTSGGLVQPLAQIGKLARAANILYLVDACQSVGQIPIDVQQIGCDLLSATGRKYLRAPRGTGLLYVRRPLIERLEPPFLDMFSATWITSDQFTIRNDARRFEQFENNYAAKIGLGVAIDYALHWGLDTIWLRVRTLAYQLRTQLAALPGVIVHDRGVTQCGIVTFTLDGLEPDTIKRRLNEQQINVSVTNRSSTLLDLQSRNLTSMVRASIHYYNTEAEIERFCTALKDMDA